MTQQQYTDYLTYIYTKRDGQRLSDSSVSKYGKEAMRMIDATLKQLRGPDFSIFEIDDITELYQIRRELISLPDFHDLDERGHRMYTAGMNRYIEYAEGGFYRGIDEKLKVFDKPILFDSAAALNQYHEHTINVPNRNRIIVKQIEEACNYMCNIDPSHRTFLVKDTEHQYMEGHHIIPLKNQKDLGLGLDCPANILVLCPTCHRFFHYGTYREREEKLKAIYDQRGERLLNSGINLDRNQFLDLANDRTKGTLTYILD